MHTRTQPNTHLLIPFFFYSLTTASICNNNKSVTTELFRHHRSADKHAHLHIRTHKHLSLHSYCKDYKQTKANSSSNNNNKENCLVTTNHIIIITICPLKRIHSELERWWSWSRAGIVFASLVSCWCWWSHMLLWIMVVCIISVLYCLLFHHEFTWIHLTFYLFYLIENECMSFWGGGGRCK